MFLVILKGFLLIIAIFTSLLYINNIITDLADVMLWNTTLHTPEEVKNKDEKAVNFASIRIILSIILAISWGLFIML